MGKINRANMKKAIYYLKRNGITNTWYAVKERLSEKTQTPYYYVPICMEEAIKQRKEASQMDITFSIVVPAYRTSEEYLKEMIDSVAGQTYSKWELIIADATEDDSVKVIIDKLKNENSKHYETTVLGQIRYVRLAQNAGIAENTNQALAYVTGQYIGLLDHDDVLTKDALYEMAVRIEEAKKNGIELKMLYSDEDKCNGDRTSYYEPHQKEDFNLDLLLSNNYICHFLVMESSFIRKLGFRSKYDGAQDYDLVLRAAATLLYDTRQIAHIPRVLYHWRCHTNSTAENPQSKQYAYDAGLNALQDFADRAEWGARAVHLKHLGFYALEYPKGFWASRKDLGAVGGRIIQKGRVIGGRMSLEGKVFYKGLPAAYSGYMHRGVLTQSAEAVDIRCIQIRHECQELFEQVVGVPYREIPYKDNMIFDSSLLPEGTDYYEVSVRLGRALGERGYGILYQPAITLFWKG